MRSALVASQALTVNGNYLDVKRSVVEAALDDMARIYGVEDDTPRSMSLPLLAPDSL